MCLYTLVCWSLIQIQCSSHGASVENIHVHEDVHVYAYCLVSVTECWWHYTCKGKSTAYRHISHTHAHTNTSVDFETGRLSIVMPAFLIRHSINSCSRVCRHSRPDVYACMGWHLSHLPQYSGCEGLASDVSLLPTLAYQCETSSVKHFIARAFPIFQYVYLCRDNYVIMMCEFFQQCTICFPCPL